MILICSINDDISTHFVMDWLIYYDQEVVRLDEDDWINVEKIQFSNSQQEILVNIHTQFLEKEILFSEIKAFWFRRGAINLNRFPMNKLSYTEEKPRHDEDFTRFLNKQIPQSGSIRVPNSRSLIVNSR